ncbi:MAG: aminotransferase class I/II-fold pyridoxal phosphate-dependent enzyme [Gemmatimonadetes bacterium]|nr:aminotransferase class I/II-fold pyridoxal phosphate-dependent enzyme [Gemmatimonadota bacterium]
MRVDVQVAAAEVLRGRAMLAENVERIRAERDRLLRELSGIPGIRVFDSAANFVLFRVESPAATHTGVFERLLNEHGILVRDVSKYVMLERCLRVNAGTPEETGAFLDALRSIMSEEEGPSHGTADGTVVHESPASLDNSLGEVPG